MDNYTEGPWRVLGNDLMQRIVSGKKIIAIPCMNDDVSAVQCGANARLIAASRDLLDALKDMHSGWKYIRETHGDLYGVGWDRSQEKAEAAIAKAEGRA